MQETGLYTYKIAYKIHPGICRQCVGPPSSQSRTSATREYSKKVCQVHSWWLGYISKYQGFMTSKLGELNLFSLLKRRKQLRLSLFFKIAKGDFPAICAKDYIHSAPTRSRVKPTLHKEYEYQSSFIYTTKNNTRCYKLLPRKTEQFKYSFFPRSVIDWNQLPEHLGQTTWAEAFRSDLQRWD